MLAVIGRRWLTVPYPSGGYALNHPTDWVCREIAEAFSQETQVIPILINDTERLTNISLPKDVSRLAKCQYLRLRHDNLDHDLARICDEVELYR